MAFLNVPHSLKDLESLTAGVANVKYHQVTPRRSLVGDSWDKGDIRFEYRNNSGINWWMPAYNYFRLRLQLGEIRVAGANPEPWNMDSDVTLAPFPVDGMMQTIQISIGGTTIETQSNFCQQFAAIRSRTSRSRAWMDGQGVTFHNSLPSFDLRRNLWCQYGYLSRWSTFNYGGVPQSPAQERAAPQPPQISTELFCLRPAEVFGAVVPTCAYNGSGMMEFNGIATVKSGPGQIVVGDIIRFNNTGLAPNQDGATFQVIAPNGFTGGPVGTTTFNTVCVRWMGGAQGPAAGYDTIIPPNNDYTIYRAQTSMHNEMFGGSYVELLWVPPLGFFEIPHPIPPTGGKWEVFITPNSLELYKGRMIQTQLRNQNDIVFYDPTNPATGVVGAIQINIQEMIWEVYEFQSARRENNTYWLDINFLSALSENLETQNLGNQIYQFNVPSKTHALTIAFQDQEAGFNPQFPAGLFHIRPTAQAPMGQELNLNQFYVQYAGVTKPETHFNGAYELTSGNSAAAKRMWFTERWMQTMLESNGWDKEGGDENFGEWLRKGFIIRQNWPKDATQNSTQANVVCGFSAPFQTADNPPLNLKPLVFCFPETRQAWKIQVINGVLANVASEPM